MNIWMVFKTVEMLHNQFLRLIKEITKKPYENKINAVFSLALKPGLSNCSLKRTYGLEISRRNTSQGLFQQ